MTPEEAWNGRKPSVHHFRVFGCLAFAHILDSQRTKLDNKSIKCIHLGVNEESKAYKLYDPEKKKIIISRDVVFEEKKSWNWGNSDSKVYNDNADSDIDVEETKSVGNNESIHSDNALEANDYPTATPQVTPLATSSDEENNVTTYQIEPRSRRMPSRFNEFVTGSELDEVDDLHNLAVYTSNDDLLDIWCWHHFCKRKIYKQDVQDVQVVQDVL
jgi:hypothetical protein